MELVSYRRRNSSPSASTEKGFAAPNVTNINNDRGEGWYFRKLRCLRTEATSKSFLLWMCFASCFQSFLVNGLINVCVSTIERRFELTSVDSGFMLGAFDIASFLTHVLPISYFGSRKGANKPRWIGCGIFLIALGSFIYAIPHFVAGRYQAEMEKQLAGTCSSDPLLYNSRNETCSEQSMNGSNGFLLRDFRHVFFFSQFIMGIGGAPLYTLGPAYIDDNVSNKMQPIYTGIMFASVAFGPALGYIAGGQLLRIYVDIPLLPAKEVGMVSGSSIWVGAWWLGFVLIGIILLFIAIPLITFPAELLGAKELADTKEVETTGSTDFTNKTIPKPNDSSDEGASICESLREFPSAIKDLAQQWSFLFLCLEQACESLLLSGVAAFLPKIIESQFGFAPSSAALIVGCLIIPCGCGGGYLGGYIIKRFQLETKSILKLSILFSGLGFMFSTTFAMTCPNQDFAGLTIPYSSEFHSSGFNSSCNANCSCSMDFYNPICGVDNVMYYSPCHAGCSGSIQVHSDESGTINNSTQVPSMTAYTQCSCVSVPSVKRITVEQDLQIDVMAVGHKCKSACTYQIYIFILLLFFFFLAKFLNSMPMLSSTLRSVPPNRRAFGLGAQMIVLRILGTIPGPILFGVIIDNSCLLWRRNEAHCSSNKNPASDKQGSCIFYDNRSLSSATLGLVLTGKAFSFVFAYLAWWFYKSPITIEEKGPSNESNQQAKFSGNDFCYDNMAMNSILFNE